MSGPPVLRVQTETGDTIDDPSEDALFKLFENLEAGRDGYLILEDLRDSEGLTYAQSSRNDDGTYVVELREGSRRTHVGTVASDMRTAHALVTGWAFDLPGWRESARWEPVSY